MEPGCLVTETAQQDGSSVMKAVCVVGGRIPTHLIVMANGMIGSASDWKYAAKQLVRDYPQDVMVHCSESNHTHLTFHGVDVMGERLATEVLAVIGRHPNLRKISFVAHSLGGLMCRYAIAKLYHPDTANTCLSQAASSSTENIRSAVHGDRIAGLEPMNFITLATPHLGCRGHHQVPMLGGLHILEKVASAAAGIGVLGKSGKHLFLTDKPPLLVQMSRDCEDLKFISALKSFKRRVLYANIRSDNVVGWSTSSIRPSNEHPKESQLLGDPKYENIVHIETARPPGFKYEKTGKVKRPETAAMEEEMMRGLTELSWERVNVKFDGFWKKITSHNDIQVKTKLIFGKGKGVIAHMVDHLLI